MEKMLHSNFKKAPDMFKIRHIGNCLKASPDYGNGVAETIDIPLGKVLKR